MGLPHLYDWRATLCNKSYTSFVTKKAGIINPALIDLIFNNNIIFIKAF